MRQVGEPLLDVLHNNTVIRNLPLCEHATHSVGFLRQPKYIQVTSAGWHHLTKYEFFGIPSLRSG